MQNLPLLNTSNAVPKAHAQGASKSGNITGQSSEAGSFQQKLTHQIQQKNENRQPAAQAQQAQQARQARQNQQTQQKSEPADSRTMVDKDAPTADLIQRKIKGLAGKMTQPETHRQDAAQSNPDEVGLDTAEAINVVDGTLIPASLNVLAQLQQTATGDAEEPSTDPALINTTSLKTDGPAARLAAAEGKGLPIAAETGDDTKSVQTGMDKNSTDKLAIAVENQRAQADKFNGMKSDSTKFDDMLPESLNKTAASREPVAGMLQNQPVSAAQTAAANLASNSLITTPPGKEGWNQAIGQRVMWMVGAAQQSATLTLNPPEMGPLQIVINVHNDKTDTAFFSDRQEVRQALQDGMDNLREMMKEAGINLGQTNINQRDKMTQDFMQQQQQAARQNTGDSAQTAEESSVSATPTRVGLGLVDTFA